MPPTLASSGLRVWAEGKAESRPSEEGVPSSVPAGTGAQGDHGDNEHVTCGHQEGIADRADISIDGTANDLPSGMAEVRRTSIRTSDGAE